jgi:hypothetical protein
MASPGVLHVTGWLSLPIWGFSLLPPGNPLQKFQFDMLRQLSPCLDRNDLLRFAKLL